MGKYTAAEKLQAALRYLEGTESAYAIAKSMGTNSKAILKWLKQYEYQGVQVFMKGRYTNYSAEFKLDVLNYMIENGTALNETAAIFGIAAPSTLSKWRKLYATQGFDAL